MQQNITPEQARHLFELACTAYDNGRFEEAQQHYLLLIKHFPGASLLRYNLGLVYFERAEFGLAVHEFTLADGMAPEDADTLFNLALSQKKTGDYLAAIDTYQRMLVLCPEHVDGLYNLAGCYRDQCEDAEAIACYLRVLALKAAYLPAITNLAYVHHRAGDNDQAAYYYHQVLERQPENESVRYLLAALRGTQLEHPPESYIRNFFDSYASEFEYSLVVELGYDNPRQLLACLGRSEARQTRCAHGLDLGCGTGLSGLVFKEIVATLDGIDLSDKMLRQAYNKGCYARIHHDSICHHLALTKETYDLFLATDVFIYIGDLVPMFTLISAVSRPEALFCFSTEHLDADGYRLLTSGRYAYSPEYIRQTAGDTGWTVVTQESAPLRREREEWLSGDLWILRRCPAAGCDSLPGHQA